MHAAVTNIYLQWNHNDYVYRCSCIYITCRTQKIHLYIRATHLWSRLLQLSHLSLVTSLHLMNTSRHPSTFAIESLNICNWWDLGIWEAMSYFESLNTFDRWPLCISEAMYHSALMIHLVFDAGDAVGFCLPFFKANSPHRLGVTSSSVPAWLNVS